MAESIKASTTTKKDNLATNLSSNNVLISEINEPLNIDEKFECHICFEDKSCSEKFTNKCECRTSFCKSCIVLWMQTKPNPYCYFTNSTEYHVCPICHQEYYPQTRLLDRLNKSIIRTNLVYRLNHQGMHTFRPHSNFFENVSQRQTNDDGQYPSIENIHTMVYHNLFSDILNNTNQNSTEYPYDHTNNILVVMQQANVSFESAARALDENQGDIVNAIIDLQYHFN